MAHVVVYEDAGKKKASFYLPDDKISEWREFAKENNMVYSIVRTNVETDNSEN